MTLIQELGVVELVLGDIVAVAEGKPVTTTQTIGSETFNLSVVVLPNGPAGTGYTVFTGGFFQIFVLALESAAELSAGAPVLIAEKIGNTWYGSTLSIAPKAAS